MVTAISTHLFLYYTLVDKPVLELIAKYGFTAIELWAMKPHFPYDKKEEIKKLREKIKRERIKVVSAHLPMYERIHEDKKLRGMLSPSSSDATIRKKWQEEATKSARNAIELGATYFTVHTDLGFSSANQTELEFTRESLKKVLDKLPSNCFLCVENDIGGIEQIEGLLNLIKVFRSEKIGLTLDLGHVLAGGGDIEECIRTAGDQLKVIHAHDNDGTQDAHLPPGMGVMQWERLFEIIEATSFRGPFVWEIRDPTLGKDENFVELEKVLQAIKTFEYERKKSRKNA
jgi:sugar phosphate isomerase/epimerase